MMSDFTSIRSMVEAVRSGAASAEEITRSYLGRIEKENSRLNAFISVDAEGAVSAAREVDQRRKKGESGGRLLGVPMAIKDNILVDGLPATAAANILRPYTARYAATVIRRLQNEGAVILGKTNLDEFAMGTSTEYSALGPTKNPLDESRVPGGSSGGSAAAVAAGLAHAALGSDTGGSIRQPAAFTGIVGFKPTYGRVSRHGLIAMASSLDQIGPFARSVEDAAAVYEVIAGRDRYDATTRELPVLGIEDCEWKNVRIGVPREFFAEGLDPRIRTVIESVLKKFEKEGARIRDISLPNASYSLPVYYIIVPAEVSANLARLDGIRYGFRAKHGNLMELYKRSRAEGFGREVQRRIMIGTYVLSHGYYDAYYAKANAVRSMIRDDYRAAFKTVDVIMGPTTPSVAFKLGSKSNDPLAMYLEDIYTVSLNLAGLPGLSLRCGTIEEDGKRLPVGLQIIGDWFSESKLLGIARRAEETLL